MQKSVTTASPTTNANLSNPSGPISGTADFYAWGIEDANDAGTNAADVRAVGVQSFPSGPNRVLFFAVNTWDRWSNSATEEFDIFIDVDPAAGNGDDYVLFAVDIGAVTAGVFNGQMAAFVQNLKAADLLTVQVALGRPSDSSTVLLPVYRRSCAVRHRGPCLIAANPRFTYHINRFDLASDFQDIVPGVGSYNAFTPSISQGAFATVPMGASGAVPITIIRPSGR